jgi:DNA-binding winged helix-turn-helix (wHTH) protein/tetratricopeptide (TPR) repeat protein
MAYVFGPFAADRAAYRVFRDERELPLTPKQLDLLFYLLDRPGTLVTKEELLDQVWPDANVTDNAVAQTVSDLREALGDDASAPSYIRTVARRGYRFIAPVTATNVSTRADDGVRSSMGSPATVPPRTLAVLDFTNVTRDVEVAWLAAGIGETVTTDFAALDHFRVVDRARVLHASRRPDAGLHEIAAAVGAELVVTGSYQRNGTRLRITARVVDVRNGEALADAKVDGRLDEVFGLQDEVVATFARELGVPGAGAARRIGTARETSSLEAYRAYTEGSLRIESLDTDQVGPAVRDFERAIEADPNFAMAYTGLANAEFVAYEMTRVSPDPNYGALRSGINHARQAVRLEPGLAEAHGTLSFLLVSDLAFDEARAAARHAVGLEPHNWRHRYRLGHAAWGAERLRALERTLALYPQLAYAHFESAMLLVARGDLDGAERIARAGVAEQDRQARSGIRFPVIGFHWLLGAIDAALGRHADARRAFTHEIDASAPRRLYGPEYLAVALTARGHADLAAGRPDEALHSFQDAHRHVASYARAWIGEAAALTQLGRAADAESAWQAVADGCDRLEHTGRSPEALLVGACAAAMHGDAPGALRRLDRFLAAVPPSHLGWTVPIEPCFAALRDDAGFHTVLGELARRAE